MELRVNRNALGKGSYFDEIHGSPHCLVGHYLAAIGITPCFHIPTGVFGTEWLFADEADERDQYSKDWELITKANDSGKPEDAIPVFARHGVTLILE